MDRKIKLRPHHSLCPQFFIGKGYSKEFTAHMWDFIKNVKEDTEIELTLHCDYLCSKCPHNHDGICESEDHIAQIDQRVLSFTKWKEHDVLTHKEWFGTAREKILEAGNFHTVCGDCGFYEICHELQKR